MKIGTAEWVRGEAQNLEAAAADALFWFRWLQGREIAEEWPEEIQERFSGMVEALSERLTEAGVIVAEALDPATARALE